MTMSEKVNIEVRDEGTVVLITPVSKQAKKWIDENVQVESWQWLGQGFAVDHRCAEDLLEGMQNELGGMQYL
jgi:virulence-associated protein VagC